MPIPTMAIACRNEGSSSAPAIIELLEPITSSAEADNSSAGGGSGKAAPTHLGIGLRFELHTNRTDGSPGYASDLFCRLDLLSIELNSSGTPPVHPTPAVHVKTTLRKEGWNHSEDYLLGGPLEPNRIRSMDIGVNWNQDQWDATIGLNDAAFVDVVDWNSAVPGRLELSVNQSGGGLSECLNEFLQGYALQDENDTIDTILSGLEVLGLASNTPVISPPPDGQDVLWQLNATSIASFIASPFAYLESLFVDSYGRWDFGKQLSTSGRAFFDHLGEYLPWAVWIDDSSDPHDGSLSIQLPWSNANIDVGLYVSRYGGLEVALDSLNLGAFSLSSSCSVDLISQSSIASTFNSSISITAVDEMSGPLRGSSLELEYDGALSIILDMPTTTYVPDIAQLINGGSLSWVQTQSSVQIFPLDTAQLEDLFTQTLPGLLLDGLLQATVDRLLLSRVQDGGLFGVIFSELGLASTASNGVMTCNSVMTILQDPGAHLRDHLCSNNGINTDTVLTILGAFVSVMDLPYTIASNTDSSGEEVVTEVAINISLQSTIVGQFAILQNPNDPDALSFCLRSPPGGLASSWGNLSFSLFLNIGSDLSVDPNGTTLEAVVNPGYLLSLANKTCNLLQDAEIAVLFSLQAGQPNLSLSIDFDTNDTTPPSVLILLPQVSGLEAFLKALLGDLITSIFPELLTRLLVNLEGVPITTNSGGTTNLGDELQTLAQSIDLWDDVNEEVVGSHLSALAADPAQYLSDYPVILSLNQGGTNYTAGNLSATGGGGGGFAGTYTVTGGVIDIVTITNPGSGYTSAPTIVISDAGDGNAAITASLGTQKRLVNLLSTGLQSIIGIVMPSSITVAQTGTQGGPDYYTTLTPVTSNAWAAFSIDIGTKNSCHGLWVNYFPTIDVGTNATSSPYDVKLMFDVSAGFANDGTQWSPNISLTVRVPALSEGTSAAFIDAPFTLRPAIEFGFASSVISLNICTDYILDGNGDVDWTPANLDTAFWAKILPSTGQPWVKDVDWGMPDLSVLLSSAADMALDFIESIPEIQTFLSTPLYTAPQPNPKDWQTALELLSCIGDRLVNFGILTYQDPSQLSTCSAPCQQQHEIPECPTDWSGTGTSYYFRSITTIITHYADPIDALMDGLMRSVENMFTQDDYQIELFSREGTSFDFTISLVDGNRASGNAILGLVFDFDDVDISLGNMNLRLFTQSGGELDAWTLDNDNENLGKRLIGQPLNPGVTFYFVEWDSAAALDNGKITPKFSLELAGIGLELSKKDDKPLLEKFLLLNAVGFVLALDLNFSDMQNNTSAIEFGGQLILDDFGIELGGGDSDGGNGMAKGLLSGGEEGKDPVKPTFDLYLSGYNGAPVDIGIKDGKPEYWFPVNKKFGPVNIAQIGVKYWSDGTKTHPLKHRLSIMVDGEAEVAGFLAQVDDLGVNFPILRPFEFNDWEFELKGLAISFTKGDLSIAGALRKEDGTVYFPATSQIQIFYPDGYDSSPPGNWIVPYVEYQGLCTITTSTLGLSAIGAFARVPKEDGTGFVSCFVIAALDIPIGGPPMFFINGLMGGIGINRQLLLPDINNINQNLFIQALGGPLARDPMGALEQIRSTFPVEHGTFWLAIGLKFTSFKVVETKAVLFARFGDGFTIGLLGLSTLDLPDASMRIACIELGIMAYYDSGENLLWAQAQLTDNSYLFTTTCKLTGGFALAIWFNTGEFVLSLGGYHPGFTKPSQYPVVPRIGFNWTPSSALTIKGDVYFTLCSSAVMLGGGLDATYKKGKLKATFMAGMDVLIIFDPFKYYFSVYINVSVKYGKLGASLGADLEIMGPKMHGKAIIELLFIKFTVKFGPWDTAPTPIPFKKFINLHVRQLEDGDANVNTWFSGEEWSTVSVTEGLIQAQGDDKGPTGDADDPWMVTPEFNINIQTKFPNKKVVFIEGDGGIPDPSVFPAIADTNKGYDLDGMYTATDSMYLNPVAKTCSPLTKVSLEIAQDSLVNHADILPDGLLGSRRSIAYLAATLWSSERPESGAAPKAFLNGVIVQARAIYSGAGAEISFENLIEPCEFNMHLPLVVPKITAIADILGFLSQLQHLGTVPSTDSGSKLEAFEQLLKQNDVMSKNKSIFTDEVEKVSGFIPVAGSSSKGGN